MKRQQPAPLATMAIAFCLSACGSLHDVPPERCADPSLRWWPLPVGAEWHLRVDLAPQVLERTLKVEAMGDVVTMALPDASWHERTAVRLWRDQELTSGWRWVQESSTGFRWLRDLYVGTAPNNPPDRVQDPVTDIYYDPYRLRLSTTPDTLCEGYQWTERYRKLTIKLPPSSAELAQGDECPRDVWQKNPADCFAMGLATTEVVSERWFVQSVGRHFDVQGEAYDRTVCVRRQEQKKTNPADTTYCFAPEIGKFLEFDTANEASNREELVWKEFP